MGLTITEPYKCPKCGARHTAFGTMDEHATYEPDENSVTACCICGAVSIIQRDLSLILATEKDMQEILRIDPAGYLQLQYFQQYIAQKAKKN